MKDWMQTERQYPFQVVEDIRLLLFAAVLIWKMKSVPDMSVGHIAAALRFDVFIFNKP